MHLVLYLLAALTAAAGIMLIGFGIPINEFSLGNTLIIAGTTALTGAVIILCLAAVNRNLKRIADLLGTRPTVPARAPEAEPVISPARSAPPRPREGAPAEDAGYDQPRFRPSTSLPGGESFDHQGHEPAPRTPPRVPAPGLAPQVPPEPPVDRRGWRPPGARTSPSAPEDNSRTPPRSAPPPRTGPEANFDSIWPTEPQPDAPPRPPRADTGAAPGPNGGGYPDLPPKTRPDTTPISVLKSGVVDGMAYTLYTDGSIEAELAQGVVRFGSIEELRNHLEKGS